MFIPIISLLRTIVSPVGCYVYFLESNYKRRYLCIYVLFSMDKLKFMIENICYDQNNFVDIIS